MNTSIRRLTLTGILIVLVAAVAVYAQARGDDFSRLASWLKPSPPTLPPQPVTLAESPSEVVTASGTLVPAQWAQLSFSLGGRVAEVLVAEGDWVQVGQVLVQLEAEELTQAVRQAQAALRAARAELARMEAGAHPQEIAAAEAAVRAAEAELSLLEANAPSAAVEAAQARVDQAQAQLARLEAGATAEELAVARAQVDVAQATLEQTRSRLKQATLRAPFAGTVAHLEARVGEIVMPGQPVLLLGDLSTLQVETDDLSEEDVAQVQAGLPVIVTLDALPEDTFRGQVIAISPMASVEQGGTNYRVTVTLDEKDPAMRWGMTAYVEITIGE